MKRKIVKIDTLKLSIHPLMLELTAEDTPHFSMKRELTMMTAAQLEILLHQICLPVTINTNEPDHYNLLKPCPSYMLLTQHPDVKNLKIQLHIYDEDDAEAVISSLLFYHASVRYEVSKGCADNLHARWRLAKELEIDTPSLKDLANLAGVDQSALRKKP